jgi:uncharacterized RmlC-like cupin family protein
VVAPNALAAGEATAGIVREVAFTTDRALLVRARVEGGMASGWHHHGEREVLGHLVSGRARFDFGADGEESVEVVEGGFFHVPAGLVHRDVNPADEPQECVLAFVGSGRSSSTSTARRGADALSRPARASPLRRRRGTRRR